MSDSVTLTIPARTENVALARTLAAAMAARADLPIDQLEDVRLAVDEAVSQLIADAPSDTAIEIAFTVHGTDLDIAITGASSSGRVPDTDTFSWTVLRALVDSVAARLDAGTVILDLHVARALPVEA